MLWFTITFFSLRFKHSTKMPIFMLFWILMLINKALAVKKESGYLSRTASIFVSIIQSCFCFYVYYIIFCCLQQNLRPNLCTYILCMPNAALVWTTTDNNVPIYIHKYHVQLIRFQLAMRGRDRQQPGEKVCSYIYCYGSCWNIQIIARALCFLCRSVWPTDVTELSSVFIFSYWSKYMLRRCPLLLLVLSHRIDQHLLWTNVIYPVHYRAHHIITILSAQWYLVVVVVVVVSVMNMKGNDNKREREQV